MTRIKLRHIHRFKDRHGVVRHYFRKRGHVRVTLPGLPGSAEFMSAYQAALAGDPLAIGASRTKPGSINALAVLYYQSAAWAQLSPRTKATYRALIEGFRAKHGDKRVATLERQHVRQLVAAKAATPAAANALLKMLRILLALAVDDGWRRDNPAGEVKRVRYVSEGHTAWTEDDITAFRVHWPADSRARLALALLLFTGQRVSDVVRMGRQHVRKGRISVRQQKTGTRIEIPIHDELAAILAANQSDHLAFLMTEQGKPFTAKGFGNWFNDAARAAGLERKTAHGLRGSAAQRLAEVGCSLHEIASITGHRSLRELERYTRAVDQVRLADSAIERLNKGKK